MTSKGKLSAYGEVYNVQERMQDSGASGEWDDYPDWYEYEMFLVDSKGNIISEWDSFQETYNGVQRLSKETAEKSVKEIVDAVKAGDMSHWFTLPEKYNQQHKAGKRTKSKKSRSASTQLRSMR